MEINGYKSTIFESLLGGKKKNSKTLVKQDQREKRQKVLRWASVTAYDEKERLRSNAKGARKNF